MLDALPDGCAGYGVESYQAEVFAGVGLHRLGCSDPVGSGHACLR